MDPRADAKLGAEGGPDYYAAFVLDPDGNNIEAVCQKPKGSRKGR